MNTRDLESSFTTTYLSSIDHRWPFVSVIVPVYNDALRIGKCIRALLEQTYPSQNYEILIIDNASTDESTSELLIDSDDHVRIVFTSGNGKWVGRWDFYPDRCIFSMDEINKGTSVCSPP